MNTYIFLNLKRFDITPTHGGVNHIAPITQWAHTIVTSLEQGLTKIPNLSASLQFPVFFPEAHLMAAHQAKQVGAPHPIEIGCQAVHTQDTAQSGNFGAFTTSLTANAASDLGCTWTLIGHSEQRTKLTNILRMANVDETTIQRIIHTILNEQIHRAVEAGLKVLYCIGENAEQVPRRESILSLQIKEGLASVPSEKIVLAYEPIWAIGPGKTPPNAQQIRETALLIKNLYPTEVVYGGGLKEENAESIGSIKELDGGLIALTRFRGEIGFYPEEYLHIVSLFAKERA